MNAAARALAGSVFVHAGNRSFSISKQMLGIIFLVIAALASALAVVYVKNTDRQLFSELQTIQQAKEALQVKYGQLLLEQNTLAAPARVQWIAQQQLGMSVPATNDIHIVTIATHQQG